MLADESFQFHKVARTVLYFFTSQFTFYQCITPVAQMQHPVGLKAVSVTVV